MDFANVKVLGVDWGHLPERAPLKDPGGYFDGAKRWVEVPSGVMGVVPAWYLYEFIETSPLLIAQRQRADEYYPAHPPTRTPDPRPRAATEWSGASLRSSVYIAARS